MAPEYLLEMYLPDGDSAGARDDVGGGSSGEPPATARLRAAAEEMRREGADVRFLRSIFVPDDETCFFLFEASSGDVVAELSRRAGVTATRISQAVDTSAAAQEGTK